MNSRNHICTRLCIALLIALTLTVAGCGAGHPKFDGNKAFSDLKAQCDFGPRPPNTAAHDKCGDYIAATLKPLADVVSQQRFIYPAEGRKLDLRNVIAYFNPRATEYVLLCAHWDTRPMADEEIDEAKAKQPILGANDGASGVAVLLELARVLKHDTLKHEVWLAFFDAEDRGRLDGWPFSVGARETARRLTLRPQAMVLVDMVGDADQNIYYEGNSHPRLAAEIWAVAGELGYGDTIIPQLRHTITDDHIPFVEMGIPAVDIIDFDYPYWHTTRDTSDKVSADSLERVGRTLQTWLEEKE